jgi:hypothetical protein
MGYSRRAVPILPLVLVSLLASALLAGCREPENISELGPRFAPEALPTGRARIYVYWPAASSNVRGAYHLSNPASWAPLLPGGYLSQSVAPGRISFHIGRTWDLAGDPLAAAHMAGPEISLTTKPGRVYYLKVVPRPGLIDQLALQAVAAATGEEEIRSCRLSRLPTARYRLVTARLDGTDSRSR